MEKAALDSSKAGEPGERLPQGGDPDVLPNPLREGANVPQNQTGRKAWATLQAGHSVTISQERFQPHRPAPQGTGAGLGAPEVRVHVGREGGCTEPVAASNRHLPTVP